LTRSKIRTRFIAYGGDSTASVKPTGPIAASVADRGLNRKRKKGKLALAARAAFIPGDAFALGVEALNKFGPVSTTHPSDRQRSSRIGLVADDVAVRADDAPTAC
jgi:hypothetical protein